MKKYKATKEQIQKSKEKIEKTKKHGDTLIKDIIKNYKINIDQLIDYIEFSSKMYNYSARNVALIQNQNPDALFCNSFKKWKELGANILKGSHGYTILVPKPVKGFIDEDNKFVRMTEATEDQKFKIKSGELKCDSIMYFGTGAVFDITQTDYPPENYPLLFSVGFSSEQHGILVEQLISYAQDEINCPVYIKHITGLGLNGYYDRKNNSITVADRLKDTQLLSTLSHEFGHALAHRNIIDKSISQVEVEADIYSIYFHSYYGLDIPDSRKRHLSNHFSDYEMELKQSGFTEEQINEKFEKILENIYDSYRSHIIKIDAAYREQQKEFYIDEKKPEEEMEI